MRSLLRLLAKTYDRLLMALAAIAAVALGLMFSIIVYEVGMRSLGFRPPVWPQALSEYTMLYSTVLAAPWILRRSDHVLISTVIVLLPVPVRQVLERIVCFIGMIVCLVVAWYALKVTLSAEGLEIRSFEMPRWMVYAPLPLGFFLLSIEFARHMVLGGLFEVEELKLLEKRSSN